MENGQLYLLELLVEKIEFYAAVKSVPQKKQINVLAVFANIAQLEIRSETPGEAQESGSKRLIDFHAGKSYLFPCNTNLLINALKKSPLEIRIYAKGNAEPAGNCALPWSADFIDMVESSEQSVGYITPMSIRTLLKFQQKNDSNQNESVGEIELFLRLSCFGKSIQTQFQVLQMKDGGRQYIFKDTNAATTFQCQKYGMTGTSSDAIPVAPIYNMVDGTKITKHGMPFVTNHDAESWFRLYDDGTQSLISLRPMEFKLIEDKTSNFSTATEYSDIVSLRDRPQEHKYYDIQTAVQNGDEISGEIEQAQIDFQEEGMFKKKSSKEDEEEGICKEKSLKEDEEAFKNELTVDRINRKLCKNKDCPGAMKFKEFGIGPLATGKGLGTIYGSVNAHTTYGMSQTYGVLDNYGPFGLFSKPKKPDEPFIPNKIPSNISVENCHHKLCDKHKKLFQQMNNHTANTCEHMQKAVCAHSNNEPLRLKGGGQVTVDDLNRPKSPLLECRVIMDQLDDIIKEYRKALGPCGKVCPYSQNVVEQSCRKVCNNYAGEEKVDLISCIDIECPLIPTIGVLCKEPPKVNESFSDCAALNCPFHTGAPKKIDKNKHLKNACGSLLCPYTKYKTGLVDQDADLEMQFLPPAVSGKCGHPKCPYPVQADLPPIHWDCPDPLPSGPCKNPDCPYLPADLKCLRVVAPKGPCGSPTCPYVMPNPCTAPHCPFKPEPCPYEMQDQNLESAGDYNRGEEDSCLEVDCPFVRPKTCKNPKCPFSVSNKTSKQQQQKIPCGNPECKQKDKGDTGSECEDSDCPFSKKKITSCNNPNCPYSTKKQSLDSSVTECPLCPETRVCENEECQNPDCPSKKKTKNTNIACENPFCPGAPKPPCCIIPECPYATPSPCPYEKNICPYSLPICFDPPPCVGPPPLVCEACKQSFSPEKTKSEMEKCGIRDIVPEIPASGDAPPEEIMGMEAEEGAIEYVVADRPVGGVDLAPCRRGTCKSTGGTLICDSCPCAEEGGGIVCVSEGQLGRKPSKKGKKTMSDPGISKKRISLKKLVNSKKWKSKYVYSVGDKYPGIQVGHRECVMPGFNVPANMGWLWNIHTPCLSLKPRRGWRPGAVTKSIAKRIRDHRAAKGLTVQELPDFTTGKKKKKHRGGIYESDSDSTIAPKPTLQIKKKEGCYFITMNPLKDPNSLADNENPYMDCTPMQFKIIKNKNKVKVKTDEEDEYRTCYCSDDEESSSSSSDSELDIEFTPPAGIIRPERLRRHKNTVHCDTQYDPKDCEVVKKDKGKKGKKDKGKKGKKDKKGKGGKKGKGKKKKK